VIHTTVGPLVAGVHHPIVGPVLGVSMVANASARRCPSVPTRTRRKPVIHRGTSRLSPS